MGVPDFGGDEQVLSLDTTIFDPLADFRFILVDEGTIKVSVSRSKCIADGGSDFAWFSLPCSWQRQRAQRIWVLSNCSPKPTAGMFTPLFKAKVEGGCDIVDSNR